MFKKAISILLACMLIITSIGVAVLSVSAADAQGAVAADDNLTITATSNAYESVTKTVDAAEDEITVTYYIQSTKKLLNFQWVLTYDSEVLELIDTDGVNYTRDEDDPTELAESNFTPFTKGNGVFNITVPGKVSGNDSKVAGYKIGSSTAKVGFVTATFKPLKSGETTVNLDVQVLNLKDSAGEYEVFKSSNRTDNNENDITPDKTPVGIYAGEYDEKYEDDDAPVVTTAPVVETTAAPVVETTAAPVVETTAAPVVETTAAPVVETTAAPVEETTAAPVVTDVLKVTATSNLFPEATAYYYDPIEEKITVIYTVDATDDYKLINGQFTLTYDPAVLKFNEADNTDDDDNITIVPAASAKSGTSIVYNDGEEGKVLANFSNIDGIKFANKSGVPYAFAKFVFEVVGKGSTVVDLDVQKFTYVKDGDQKDVDKHIVLDADMDDYQEKVEALYATAKEITTKFDPEGKDPIDVPEPEKDSEYTIAGSGNLIANGWSPVYNTDKMVKGDDGKFTQVFEGVEPSDEPFMLKVLEWSNGEDISGLKWWGIGSNYDMNCEFAVNSKCDVTVTYDPETHEITVTGDGVGKVEFKLDKVTACGNGEDTWLNGISWDPNAESNKMTEVSDGVYEITFDDIEAYNNYQVKFPANGSWALNWGCDADAEKQIDTTDTSVTYSGNAKYDGANIIFENPFDIASIKLTLDVTKYDSSTREGATYKIEVKNSEPVSTGLVVNAVTKNEGFPEPAAANEDGTVTAAFPAPALADGTKLISTQFNLNYDKDVLELVSVEMPFVTGDSDSRLEPVFNTETAGVVKGSVSDLNGFTSVEPAYVTAVFKALADEGETTVELEVTDYLVEGEPTGDNKINALTVQEDFTGSADGTTVDYSFVTPLAEGTKLISTQFTLTYDPELLKITSIEFPFADGEGKIEAFNTNTPGTAKGSVSNLDGYTDVTKGYVHVVFETLKPFDETDVTLDVTDILIEGEPVPTTAPAETTEPVETTAPVIETTTPAETTEPVETTAPVVETTAPVVETTAPVETTVEPVETTAPVVETTAPVVETTAPATTAPATAAPATTAPVGAYVVTNGGTDGGFTTEVVTPKDPETGKETIKLTATDVEGKDFTGWTLPDGAKLVEGSLTDKTIVIEITGDVTVTPNYAATTATSAPATTVAATTKPATSDTPTNNNTTNNGTVQTGAASMAIVILLVLVSGTAAIYFARKRESK